MDIRYFLCCIYFQVGIAFTAATSLTIRTTGETSTTYPIAEETTNGWWSTESTSDLFTGTPYPSEEDMVLRCASSSFQVDIPKHLIEGNYSASDFYLSGDPNNSACKGFYNGAWYISLNSSLTECGTQFYENGTKLHYQNMVELNPSDVNSVVDFLGVEIPITCEYNSSKALQTHFKTLNDVIGKQEKGAFEFDFAMYTDVAYSARYYSYPVETKLNEKLYFRAELLRSANNLEIHLRSCRATPSPDYNDAIVYEFIRAGCGINGAPVRVLSPNKKTQADFEITSFRFRKDLSHPHSQIWVHCEVVLCDVSDANSECHQGCEQSRHRRSAKSPPLKTKRMVQGPIILSSKDNDISDIAAMSQNKDGSSRVVTVFLSAVSLIMMTGFVAMAVVLTKVIRSSKQQGYQPLPNPSEESVA